MHGQVEGRLKSITLTRTVTGKHYASLLFETEQLAILIEHAVPKLPSQHLEDMCCFGFKAGLGKDRLGVVIDRNGGLIKSNKGLHRKPWPRPSAFNMQPSE